MLVKVKAGSDEEGPLGVSCRCHWYRGLHCGEGGEKVPLHECPSAHARPCSNCEIFTCTHYEKINY